ncbi:hypothetical protein T11_6326 [Trichinella zimbabwensis]|uniref:Uncharacterized protein n=1 Tax=Trichinella zimbabwensis TaxID=268475 RepID=A0A0V1G9J5_9BILA|nr:hypothetical protein T11_6326 [Trichinella zimbabwensis]
MWKKTKNKEHRRKENANTIFDKWSAGRQTKRQTTR